jgi:hypothetical protein
LDSTSHNYIWQLDTLTNTPISSSILRDVAIINDTTVWAVGNMYVLDSSGLEKNYNLAVWNGNGWRLEDVLIPTCNDSGREIGASGGNLMSVFSYSASDIWIASRASLIHWNGTTFERICNPQGPLLYALQKIWGATENTVYMVGPTGLFARYAGGVWQKIFTGTDIDLTDIWGTSNNDIWIAGVNPDGGRSVLLHYDGSSVRTVYSFNHNSSPDVGKKKYDSLAAYLKSVWTDNDQKVWIAGVWGVYTAPQYTHGEAILGWGPDYDTGVLNNIRGEKANNIFAVGDFGTLVHFNGSSWKHYIELQDFSTSRRLSSVAVRNSLMVAVGVSYNRAIALRGRRIN